MQEEIPAVSQEDKAKMIQDKESTSEVTMDQVETSPESADPPASASTNEAGSENQLRLFVTLLTVRVMNKCHALQNRSQEEWVAHTKSLVNQTLEGLTISKDFCPDAKTIKKTSKAVLNDLEKKFCGKKYLRSLITLQDTAVDTVIVQALQVHITKLFARLAKKCARVWWHKLLPLLAFSGCILGGIFILVLIL